MSSDVSAPSEHPSTAPTALPHPPLDLTAPPPPSARDLDDASWRHVERLCDQSLAGSKVSAEIWREPLLKVLHDFADSVLTPEAIASLAASKFAEAEVAAKVGDPNRRAAGEGWDGVFGGLWWLSGRRERSTDSAPSEETKEEKDVRERRRARWREAALRLPSPPSTGEGASDHGHARETSMDDWNDVELPKVTVLRLNLEVIETTLGAVNKGTASFGVSYAAGEWRGHALFGRDGLDLDEADLKLVHRLGGTFQITATSRDAPKLERLLELLVFAVVSLKLEVHLLADLSCSHPPDPEPSEASAGDRDEVASIASRPEPEEHDSIIDLGRSSHTNLRRYATEHYRRLPRTSFARSSASSWLDIVKPHPTVQAKSRRGEKKRLFSKSSAVHASAPSSPTTPTTPTSPSTPVDSPTPDQTPDRPGVGARFKGKIKGILPGNRRGLKPRDLRLMKAATIGTDTVEPEEKGLFGGLGFSLGGLGFGTREREKSASSEVEDKKPVEAGEDEPGVETSEDANGERKEGSQDAAPTAATATGEAEKAPLRFEKVVQSLASWVLSVSPDVFYHPPHLLSRLSQQEHLAAYSIVREPLPSSPVPPPSEHLLPPTPSQDPNRPVSSYFSLGTSAGELGLGAACGTPGAVNHKVSWQSTALTTTSSGGRITLDALAGLSSLLTNNTSVNGTIRHQSMQFLVQTVRSDAPPGTIPCQAPRWVTFSFYQHRSPTPKNPSLLDDSSLSSVIRQLVSHKDATCAACSTPNKDHKLVMMHHEVRIEVLVRKLDDDAVKQPVEEDEHDSIPPIQSWTTCVTCQSSTAPKPLTAAASSYSFSKVCELLIYGDLKPNLCEHDKDQEALVRSFAVGKTAVELRLGKIALFELRLPTAVDPDVEPDEEGPQIKPPDSHSPETLRTEIDTFFSDVRARLDAVEDRLVPTPSSADGQSESFRRHDRSSSAGTVIEDGGDTAKEAPLPASDEEATLAALRRLCKLVDEDESACQAVADGAAPYRLNAARSFFEIKAKALKLRLAAWEKKHAAVFAAGPGPELPSPAAFIEPDYFDSHVHAFAVDSPILVRDGELSSLIALTLSAAPFQDAVSSATASSSRIVTPSSVDGLFPDAGSRRPSAQRNPIPSMFLNPNLSVSPLSGRSITPPPHSPARSPEELDADDPAADFSKPSRSDVEGLVVKSRKPPQISHGSMLRHLMRQKSHEVVNSADSTPSSTPGLDRGAFDVDPAVKRFSRAAPLSDSVLDDLLKTRESAPPTPRGKGPPARGVPTFMAHLAARREGSAATASIASAEVRTPSATTTPQTLSAAGTIRSIASLQSLSSAAADSSSYAPSFSSATSGDENSSAAASLAAAAGSPRSGHDEHHDEVPPLLSPAPTASGFLGKKLDGLFAGIDSVRSRVSGGTSPRLGPLSDVGGGTGTGSAQHPQEHIKLKFRQGSKSYRVTAFYAKRFQMLRAKCGLSESLFVESLSRCSDLNPSGGKSTACFLMTGDKRFILKELVTKFGASERETLLNVAPKLLDYLMHPERPSLLAKIFGVYTVKICDGKGVKRKVDLVVMENLFFDVCIASRVTKPKPGVDAKEGTGWDADWLTGSLRDQLLIYPHSKTLLRESLKNDVEFLSANDGIDFSLLIGVDDHRRELVVGLIDTIGVFNALKRVEHLGKTIVKHATASEASDVTVLPPREYADRFLSAMERYFQAVPDKWSRPPGDGAVDPAPRLACPL
ncbi:hypothetical protein JCM8097_004022 [Rhodosporidiobolus ruineniae]